MKDGCTYGGRNCHVVNKSSIDFTVIKADYPWTLVNNMLMTQLIEIDAVCEQQISL